MQGHQALQLVGQMRADAGWPREKALRSRSWVCGR